MPKNEFIWEHLRPLLGNKKFSRILNKNTSPYFHRASIAIWPFTMLKRTHVWRVIHFYFYYVHKKRPRLYTPFPNARSGERKIQALNDQAATNLTQVDIHQIRYALFFSFSVLWDSVRFLSNVGCVEFVLGMRSSSPFTTIIPSSRPEKIKRFWN